MPEFLDNDTIDIRQTTVEAPKRTELLFDIEEVVDRHAWQMMKEKLRSLWESQETPLFLTLLSEMCLIYPDRRQELALNDTVWQSIKNYVENLLPSESQLAAIRRSTGPVSNADQIAGGLNVSIKELAKVKIAFPEQKDCPTDTTLLNKAEELLTTNPAAIRKENYMNLAQAMKLLTGHDSVDVSNTETIQALTAIVQSETQDERVFPDLVAFIAARSKIILGKNYRPGILTKNDWEAMREHVLSYSDEGRVIQRAEMASYMKILAADEVRITESGVELIMPKPHTNEDSPVMPEQREF
jgi:hypothetical protein